jgi:3-hydroxymyristoyl/3-hydroxydecanoyl-(acyl carrier protein) dehydratase
LATHNAVLSPPTPQPKVSQPVVPSVVPSVPQTAAQTMSGALDAALDSRALHAFASTQNAAAGAHGAYLKLAERQTQDQLVTLAHRAALLEALAPFTSATQALETQAPIPNMAPTAHPVPHPLEAPVSPAPFMDREACLAFARGTVGSVLGAAYAGADAFPTRVRLPDEPLMLVDRIMSVSGEPMSLGSGTVVTEHDVRPGLWYLDAGRIPTCVAVEAGQADLFLSGYLGIDFETRGLACYRLLDAVVTFHAPLPAVGSVIVYDIAIERFMRQGDTWIFFFHFEATVNGHPLISMQKGCAGFFTPEQLADGKGVVHTALDLAPLAGKRPANWRELAPMALEAYDGTRIDRLRAGDLPGAFGVHFAQLGLVDPARLPDGLMRLVHRITRLEPTGGRCGIGYIEGEADIHPNDWFLTCHFVDDQVMPGTLMYECCMHTLRVFLMRLGWVGESSQVVYEPVPGIASTLKCRGQVLASTRLVTYQITLKELGYDTDGNETPFAIADALMLADGKPIVQIKDMSVRASGLGRTALEAMWQRVTATVPQPERPLYGPETILAYATGKPSEAFGAPYLPFDSERIIARLPGPPYMFLDRVSEVTGPPWIMKAGAGCVAHYDIPADAWYFAEEGQATMPFAILLEVGLQPCGWLAGYVGSALTSPIDMSFRNLGGHGTQHGLVTPDMGTLTTRVELTKVSASGGMVIQEYAFNVTCNERPIYSATTSFGFFTKVALAQQVGVRGVEGYEPTPLELARVVPLALDEPPLPLPKAMLRMIDGIDCYIPNGGPHGQGFVRGYKQVDPNEWFFKAHFYQDPVCPGSLGLESMLQLLKLVAARRFGAQCGPDATFEVMALETPHEWIYRGQILPTNQRVTVEATLKRVDEKTLTIVADGLLRVDGLSIYQMKDFTLSVRPARR